MSLRSQLSLLPFFKNKQTPNNTDKALGSAFRMKILIRLKYAAFKDTLFTERERRQMLWNLHKQSCCGREGLPAGSLLALLWVGPSNFS